MSCGEYTARASHSALALSRGLLLWRTHSQENAPQKRGILFGHRSAINA